MEISYDPIIYKRVKEIIRSIYGPDAAFRDGQYEAIEATLTRNRTLVVQRTGWGKSLVYFACTKIFREEKRGVTLVVSPLLVLMENQQKAADNLGLKTEVLNSRVKERREEIISSLEKDEIDILFITPETLFRNDLQEHIKNIRIGLFVIDEAHCISDWGHDFRLEYGNLRKIIRILPLSTPILATTATANNRVIADLQTQLGNNVYVSRGPLSRDSLHIQILNKPGKAERYAWLLENIPKLPGSGIIYCLTQRDCDYLSDFLKKHKISAEPYYSKNGEDNEKINRETEEKFMRNQLKVIVATIKLGMGYDKGDIAFIIHFQMPSNIVSYYQQIGRAGRNIELAFVFLMYGEEDERILNYFIETAFPTASEMERIIGLIENNNGSKESQIVANINIRKARIEKALSFLENDGFIRKENGMYYLTPKRFVYDRAHYDHISAIRKQEIEQMKGLSQTKKCLSRYIVTCLDDNPEHDCGKCANCIGKELLSSTVSQKSIEEAEQYLNRLIIPIEPRKMWAASAVTKNSKIKYQNEPGICLCKYGDVGYGELVKRDKYSPQKRFCDALLGKSVDLLRSFVQENRITAITGVPSLRSNIVQDFSARLAESLKLPFIDILEKVNTPQQKEMENSSFQCANAYRSFFVKQRKMIPESVLLVDDMVDSKWTITVCGYKLMEAGVRHVFPFALADSSNREN